MAKKNDRIQIKLKSSGSPHIYYSMKNKKNTTDKVVLKKYDPVIRKHTIYKEHK